MNTKKRENVNGYWDFVKEKYPDARFGFWYSIGELLFYPDGKAEENDERVHSCFKENGQLVIKSEF